MSAAALDAYGWRIAFLIGATTLPLGLWLRSSLPEALHVPEAGRARTHASGSRLRIASANARVLILGLFILASGTIITYVTNYMTTYAEDTLQQSLAQSPNINRITLSSEFASVIRRDRVGVRGGDRALRANDALPLCFPHRNHSNPHRFTGSGHCHCSVTSSRYGGGKQGRCYHDDDSSHAAFEFRDEMRPLRQ